MFIRDNIAKILAIPSAIFERYGQTLGIFLLAFSLSGAVSIYIIYKSLYWKASSLQITPADVVSPVPSDILGENVPDPSFTTGVTNHISPTPIISSASLININTASLSELDSLPGIGSVYAQRIIDARPFASIQSITKVEGIGAKTFQKIKDLITIE